VRLLAVIPNPVARLSRMAVRSGLGTPVESPDSRHRRICFSLRVPHASVYAIGILQKLRFLPRSHLPETDLSRVEVNSRFGVFHRPGAPQRLPGSKVWADKVHRFSPKAFAGGPTWVV